VPNFCDSFWVYQLCDLAHGQLGSLGKCMAAKPDFYYWPHQIEGETPRGIEKVFPSPANLGVVSPRLFVSDDAGDKQSVQPIVSQILIAHPPDTFRRVIGQSDYALCSRTTILRELCC
jgi:hypothetical protein